MTTALRSSIAASLQSGAAFHQPYSPSTTALQKHPAKISAHRHVSQYLEALTEKQPDHPVLPGVLDAAHTDVVEFIRGHNLHATKVDPESIALHLTGLNTPTCTLLYSVWHHDQPDKVQDRLIPLLTADHAEGTMEVFADATDLSEDTISMSARPVSTARPEATLSPITDEMLLLILQLPRYLRIANLARHVPTTMDLVSAACPPTRMINSHGPPLQPAPWLHPPPFNDQRMVETAAHASQPLGTIPATQQLL